MALKGPKGSKTAKMKEYILEILSDGKEHTSLEMVQRINEKGLEIDQANIRSVIYLLRKSGIDIDSKERGVYQLKKKEKIPLLRGFTTVVPEEKSSPKYIYIHDDGSVRLSSTLNNKIKSRTIEIRLDNTGKRIALIPDGENSHKFSKSGCTKNSDLIKLLKGMHISVPATYEMNLDSKTGIWIGDWYKNLNVKKVRKKVAPQAKVTEEQ